MSKAKEIFSRMYIFLKNNRALYLILLVTILLTLTIRSVNVNAATPAKSITNQSLPSGAVLITSQNENTTTWVGNEYAGDNLDTSVKLNYSTRFYKVGSNFYIEIEYLLPNKLKVSGDNWDNKTYFGITSDYGAEYGIQFAEGYNIIETTKITSGTTMGERIVYRSDAATLNNFSDKITIHLNIVPYYENPKANHYSDTYYVRAFNGVATTDDMFPFGVSGPQAPSHSDQQVYHYHKSNLAPYLDIDTTAPPAPTASPTGGTYNASKSVTLSDTESGVTIRYTTNGTEPTASSTVYSSAITISSTTTLKAKAWDAAGNPSTTMTQTYTIDTTAPPAPTASPAGGTYNVSKSVILSDTESGVTIRYTTNGTDPTVSSTVYSSTITISSTTTLKAKAWDALGNPSTTMTQTYTIDTIPPANPSISISPTTLTKGNVTVTITYPADAATKSYNINGGTSSSYTGAFTVSSNCTINASCADAVGNWSEQVSKDITNIDKTAPTNPSISISPTAPTNGNVTVTITYPADAATKSYNINGGTSSSYTGAFTVSSNCTINASCADAAGNWSGQVSKVITNIDKTAPTNPSISISPTTTTKNVTVTITYPADAATKSYNINGGTSSSYTGAFTVSNNCTINASCADAAGNWSGQVSYVITNIHIYPTLNTPTISGSIYLGEDITLTDTGTDIDQAVYRVYYTTNVTAPILTDGAESPGTGWFDSGLSSTMMVTGGTGLSKIIAGASLSNNNWTYVVFKVWAASPTNDSVTKYSQAYVVSNDGNSAINYVGHNQIIKILNTNTDVVVSDPDTPVEAYNPDPTSVGYLDQNNLFENQNPFMKYRLEFDVLKPQIVKDVEIDFDFNYYNDYWIEFRPKTMILEKLNNDGTVAGILKTYNIDGVSYTKQSTNRYILKLGNDNEGNPIILANGQGRYAIEYTGELIVQANNLAGIVLMRHNAKMYIFTTTSIYPDTLEAQRPSRKFYIDTKVTKH